MTKKYKKRAEADVGLMFTAYNLRRLMNILGTKALKVYLKALILLCIRILDEIKLKISQFNQLCIFNKLTIHNKIQSLKIDYI